jgi:hypothetical protein
MTNASTGRARGDLTTLYDRLESYLRTLETLGRTKDKFADLLAPLVESCLPEEILRLWERKRAGDEVTSKNSEMVSQKLMKLLRSEVHGEQRLRMVRQGFGKSTEETIPVTKWKKQPHC